MDSSTCIRIGWLPSASSCRRGSVIRRALCTRYLQHFIQHPALWRHLKDGTLRSWGAKSLDESGQHGEPFLAGDGYARIGEGSGSTNMLAGSGVDEAWTTGTQLGDAVIELLQAGRDLRRKILRRPMKRDVAQAGLSAMRAMQRMPATVSITDSQQA